MAHLGYGIAVSRRKWNPGLHLRHLNDNRWVPMTDLHGATLRGIEGMHGIRDQKLDGASIGADFIRMQPGSSFPLHTHDGDHELYVIHGNGLVFIDSMNVRVHEGHLIHIPAEYPHQVWVPGEATSPFIFIAMGHPHRLIADRMTEYPSDHPAPGDLGSMLL